MKNKKVVILLTFIILVVIVLGVVIVKQQKKDDEILATGAFNEMGFTFDKYKVSVQSVEVGHPAGEFGFETRYISDTYTRENYKFKYDILIGVKCIEDSINKVYPNYNTMKKIQAFNKEFKCEEISDKEIILLYKQDDDFYITINLIDYSDCYGLDGNYIYDENGNVLMLEKYDFLEFVKENEEFSNALKIEINKN